MTAVIEVQNLTKHYKEKNALDNVSLTLEGGAIYGPVSYTHLTLPTTPYV